MLLTVTWEQPLAGYHLGERIYPTDLLNWFQKKERNFENSK
jgi:hypothetical protein